MDGVDGVDGVHPAHGVPDGRQQGRVVTLADVAVPRPGQAVAFVLDTRPCPAAGELAARAGVRTLVLTHFSQRYGDDGEQFAREAREVFDGDVVAAEDLDEIPVPPRERDQSGRSPATS